MPVKEQWNIYLFDTTISNYEKWNGTFKFLSSRAYQTLRRYLTTLKLGALLMF
jgi:hypothetical protein